jgi:hypothetical protein
MLRPHDRTTLILNNLKPMVYRDKSFPKETGEGFIQIDLSSLHAMEKLDESKPG